MSEQFTIDGGAEPLAKPDLGPRQQLVLKALEERGGLDADEVGALIHASRGKHDEDTRCQWCGKEGNDVLRSLRARGLVVHRRHGSWELTDPPKPADEGAAAPGSVPYGEFPEGF